MNFEWTWNILLPAVYILFQTNQNRVVTELSRVARFVKPAQKGTKTRARWGVETTTYTWSLRSLLRRLEVHFPTAGQKERWSRYEGVGWGTGRVFGIVGFTFSPISSPECVKLHVQRKVTCSYSGKNQIQVKKLWSSRFYCACVWKSESEVKLTSQNQTEMNRESWAFFWQIIGPKFIGKQHSAEKKDEYTAWFFQWL